MNIYKASIMRSVTETKKNTAIKELHPALVPKWAAIPDTDTSDFERATGEDRLNVDTESKSYVESSSKTGKTEGKQGNREIYFNGAVEPSLVESVGDKAFSCAVISSHSNELLDCDKIKSETVETSDKFIDGTMTNSGDRIATVGKSSHSETDTDTSGSVKDPLMPMVPKMKYFFERGDSLKKEEGENLKSVGMMEANLIPDSDTSGQSKGVKRTHKPEVGLKHLILTQ